MVASLLGPAQRRETRTNKACREQSGEENMLAWWSGSGHCIQINPSLGPGIGGEGVCREGELGKMS